MNKTHITNKEYLFALCITDGLFEEITEQEKSLVILAIRETLRKEKDPPIVTPKTPKKYQNNEGCQNNEKVSK